MAGEWAGPSPLWPHAPTSPGYSEVQVSARFVSEADRSTRPLVVRPSDDTLYCVVGLIIDVCCDRYAKSAARGSAV